MMDARTTCSIALVSALAGALLAGCGGGTKAGTGGTGDTGGTGGTGPEPAPPTLAPGSSGFPGLDWGDTMAAVQAVYPAAEELGDGLELKAPHGGLAAVTSFMFTGDQLISIDVGYPDQASMEACAEVYHPLREEIGKQIGPTGDDNLGAFWTLESAQVQLTCNPGEGDGGSPASLSMSYSLPEPEEGEM